MMPDQKHPDRGYCVIEGCYRLQHNHGKNRWGKYCGFHHKEPIARAERKAVRAKHRELLKAEIAARAIEYRRNTKLVIIYPRACVKCGLTKLQKDYPKTGRACKACVSKRHKERWLEKEYGIKADMYKAILLAQNNVCAICGNPPNGGRSLAVDHCHETNTVRGLLCFTCNVAIGCLQDDLDLLASASSYLINSRLQECG